MLKIEYRQMLRSNGLIDDFVVYGSGADYLALSKKVDSVVAPKQTLLVDTTSDYKIEVIHSNDQDELFTSLQNERDEYFSIHDWNNRKKLRVIGANNILTELRDFLSDLSTRGEGYSYISEFSERYKYSANSPEWRLHVDTF